MIGAGSWALHPHVLFETSAYFIAFRIYLVRRRRHGDVIGDSLRWSVITAAAIGAVTGSRILFWLEDPQLTAAHATDGAFLIGGKTIVGALLGGWIGVEVMKRMLGIREATGDLFAVPLAFGIAMGRIGCFLTGLDDRTHGVPSSMPWAVDLGDGVRRHPTALYESAFALLLGAVLLRISPPRRRGNLFKIFMVSYLAFRLLVEVIKPEVRVALGLTSIQWACVAGLAYYVQWYAREGRVQTPPPRAIAT